MASTKRVTGNYDIYADVLNIYGNLNVEGTTTTVNSEIVDVNETITTVCQQSKRAMDIW